MTDQPPPAYPTTMDELHQCLARSREITDPVAFWVAGNSYQHDDEHRPWIEGLLTKE